MFIIVSRQQREEISRKKEKMESMLKGKKSSTGVARPESPGSRRRRSLRRSTLPSRRIASSSRGNIDVCFKINEFLSFLYLRKAYFLQDCFKENMREWIEP